MSTRAPDVSRSLAYGVNAASRALLPIGLVGLAAGLFLLWTGAGKNQLPGLAGVVLGLGVLGWAAWRNLAPAPPLLELSPAGLLMRVPGATEFTVPWPEIRGVEALDVTLDDVATRYRRTSIEYRNVTAVSVTRDFYDRVIHVDSALLRGPGWDTTFIEHGDLVQIALHHELLRVPPDELRVAVEARWRAFGSAAGRKDDRARQPGGARAPAPRRRVVIDYAMTPYGLVLLIGFAAIGLMIRFDIWPFDFEARRLRAEAERQRTIAQTLQRVDEMRRKSENDARERAEERARRETAAAAERARVAALAKARAEAEAERERAETAAAGPLPAPSPVKIEGHAGAVLALAVAPNQRGFVSAGADGAAKYWDTRANTALRDLAPTGPPLRAVVVAPDGRSMLAGGDDGRIVRRALPDGEMLRDFGATDRGPVLALATSGDEARFVSLHASGAIMVWNAAGGASAAIVDGGRATAIALSGDGARLVVGDADGALRVRDVAREAWLRSIATQAGAARALALTPDGRSIVSAHDDAALRLTDIDSGAEIRRFAGHAGPVLAVAIDAAGARLATAGADGTARLWDVATGAELLRVASLKGVFRAIGFVSGGRFVTGSDDGLIRLWDDRGVERMRYFAAVAR